MTPSADDIISSIRLAFETDFTHHADTSGYLATFIKALHNCNGSLAKEAHKQAANEAFNGADLPTLTRHLSNMQDSMVDTPVSLQLQPLIGQLDWYQIFEGGDIDAEFAAGLLAGQIIGKRGLVRADDVFVGLFLLAPGICYPLHQHPALEVYYVLSGRINIRHGRTKEAMQFRPGEISVTPPHQVHELRTGDEPCLMAYIWTGDMTGENWWWEEQQDKTWDRICWERQADSSWAIAKREALSNDEIIRAGDR